MEPRIPKKPLGHQRKPDPTKWRQHGPWIKTLNCAICGAPNPDPHHIRGQSTGMGRRDDRFQIPLCRQHHAEAHQSGDTEGWLMMSHGIEGRALAAALGRVSGDRDKGLRILARAKRVGG